MNNPIQGRRGSAYVLVLAVATTLTIMGGAGLALVRAERTIIKSEEQARAAAAAAQSGLDLGLEALRRDPTGVAWRLDGLVFDRGRIDKSELNVLIEDPADGVLVDDDTQRVSITSTATNGNARRIVSMRCDPVLSHLRALSAGLACASTVSLSSATFISEAPLAAQGAVTADKSVVSANVVAPSAAGSSYLGTNTLQMPDMALPVPAVALLQWSKSATPIAYASTGGLIDLRVIGPGYNPYGATLNADGVYIIDCAGQPITIRRTRVVGTLILVNPGAASSIQGSCSFESASDGAPALIVQGAITIGLSAADLSEATLATNFNPVGAPALGVTDVDLTDSYASMITGLVYITGSLTCSGMTVEGCVLVGGTCTLTGETRIRRGLTTATIPGFQRVSDWRIEPGSLSRTVE